MYYLKQHPIQGFNFASNESKFIPRNLNLKYLFKVGISYNLKPNKCKIPTFFFTKEILPKDNIKFF